MPNLDGEIQFGLDYGNLSQDVCNQPNWIWGNARIPTDHIGGDAGSVHSISARVNSGESGGRDWDELLAELETKLRKELRFDNLPMNKAVAWIARDRIARLEKPGDW